MSKGPERAAGGAPPVSRSRRSVLALTKRSNPAFYEQWLKIQHAYGEWYCETNLYNMLPFCASREFAADYVRFRRGEAKSAFHEKHMLVTNRQSLDNLLLYDERAVSAYSHLESVDAKAIIRDAKTAKRMSYWQAIRKELDDYATYERRRQWAYDLDCAIAAWPIEKRIMASWADARKLIDYYHSQGVMMQAVFSGSKGFHIELEQWGEPNTVRHDNLEEAKALKELLRLGWMDTTIYSKRREWRVPYSIHGKTGLVCWPLSEEYVAMLDDGRISEFLEMMRPERLVHCERLKNRGKVLL